MEIKVNQLTPGVLSVEEVNIITSESPDGINEHIAVTPNDKRDKEEHYLFQEHFGFVTTKSGPSLAQQESSSNLLTAIQDLVTEMYLVKNFITVNAKLGSG